MTTLAGVTLNTLLDAIHAAGKQAEILSDVYVEIGRTATATSTTTTRNASTHPSTETSASSATTRSLAAFRRR
jgi:hypothetical protein